MAVLLGVHLQNAKGEVVLLPVYRVLFVDDEPATRSAVKRELQGTHYRVDLACSGTEALGLAKRVDYDVVVTDLAMPGLPGDEVLRRLRPMLPSAAFLITSGARGVDMTLIDQDVVSFVRKPWSDLREALDSAVALHRRASSPPPEKLRLLLIEDNPGDVELVERRLEDRFDCQHVKVLADGVARLAEEHFDLVVTDLSLPDACGLDAVSCLARAAPNAALVVLTGSDDSHLLVEAMQRGVQEFLVKSELGPGSLARALERARGRKDAELRLERDASRDPLTGLYNRRAFLDRLRARCSRASRASSRLAVVYLDLDGFKPINDTHGHRSGDTVLCAVAERLQVATRNYDAVARLGGDEFALLLEDIGDPKDAQVVAERALAAVSREVVLPTGRVSVTASVGMAMFPDSSSGFDQLLEVADAAMYRAKRKGKNRIVLA